MGQNRIVRLDPSEPWWRRLTVVGDVGDLEAFAAVALVRFELDPELAGARGEGDGPLVGLTRLIGGDGGGEGWRSGTTRLELLHPCGIKGLKGCF